MKQRKGDIIGLVEAAYRLDGSQDEWLDRLLELCAPHLDQGLGLAAFTFRIEDGALHIQNPRERGTRKGFVAAYASISQQTPFTAIERAYLGAPGLETYRSVFADSPAALEAMDTGIGPALGLTDFAALNALDPTGRGVAVVAPMTEATPPGLGTQRWLRVATHIAAGLRLRGAPIADRDLPLGAEALLEGDGTLVEARGVAQGRDARAALRDAARKADEARGRLRHHDGERALALWEGLVDGRWSLVDFFDSDGRRFLVARQNDPRVQDPRSLTARERQIVHYVALGHTTKVVAYDLGLAESTVDTHLKKAMRKLGLKSRAALTYFIRRLDSSSASSAD